MISPTAFQKMYRSLLSHSSSPVTEQHNASTENSAGAQTASTEGHSSGIGSGVAGKAGGNTEKEFFFPLAVPEQCCALFQDMSQSNEKSETLLL